MPFESNNVHHAPKKSTPNGMVNSPSYPPQHIIDTYPLGGTVKFCVRNVRGWSKPASHVLIPESAISTFKHNIVHWVTGIHLSKDRSTHQIGALGKECLCLLDMLRFDPLRPADAKSHPLLQLKLQIPQPLPAWQRCHTC